MLTRIAAFDADNATRTYPAIRQDAHAAACVGPACLLGPDGRQRGQQDLNVDYGFAVRGDERVFALVAELGDDGNIRFGTG